MTLKGLDLSFGYDKQSLLFEGVNISLGWDEVLGIQGYSGSGKTTLGKILSGYLPSRSGNIEVDGIDHKKFKGFNPVQLIHQHPEKSINPLWKMRRVLEEGSVNIHESMELFGIREDWLGRWPIELSGGEQQRFCIARVFSENTSYIIADEITTMLDGITQAVLWKVIIDLCVQRKIGLIVISHDMALLNKLCDRVIDFNKLCVQH